MNLRLIAALAAKDLSIFFRNKLFAVVTVVGIVAYIAIYFVMPSTVDETLQIGVYAPAGTPPFGESAGEGLRFTSLDSEESLRQTITDGDLIAGISLPDGYAVDVAAGRKPAVRVFFAADTPAELQDIIAAIVTEMGYAQAGVGLNVQVTGEILGQDPGGVALPPRDRLRPLLAVMLIMVETLGLANLISEEIERRTLQAVLVTPATAADVLVAKGIAGVGLAFGQAALFMGIVGGLGRQPLVVLSALLLGAVLVIAAGFIIGSLAKDMLSVLAWSMPVIIILIIPSMGVAFPGSVSGWVKALPSHYLVDAVYRASNFGASWGALWQELLILTGFDAVLVGIGVFALGRKAR